MDFLQFSILTVICALWVVSAWHEKVKLTDVQVLTLHSGQMTTGRRSSPVSQLSCVGGSSGCRGDLPTTVQCYNRGFDGSDVQWECKADMSSKYRFGRIEVSCEGYDYPDDPYILKGSCGLEYNLDYTHGYGGHSNSDSIASRSYSSFSGVLVFIIVCAVLLYFCSGNSHSQSSRGRGGGGGGYGPDTYPYSGGSGHTGYNEAPPPYNYNDNFSGYGSSCGGRNAYSGYRSNGGPGFFSGLGLGGGLGYLFGSRNQGYNNAYYNRGPSTSYYNSSSSGSSSQRHTSSGTFI